MQPQFTDHTRGFLSDWLEAMQAHDPTGGALTLIAGLAVVIALAAAAVIVSTVGMGIAFRLLGV